MNALALVGASLLANSPTLCANPFASNDDGVPLAPYKRGCAR